MSVYLMVDSKKKSNKNHVNEKNLLYYQLKSFICKDLCLYNNSDNAEDKVTSQLVINTKTTD